MTGSDPSADDVDALLRSLAPQVLGILARRHGRFDAAEDAVQEALLAASIQWPVDGVPANPRGWLVTVGARRLTDELRAETARVRREQAVGAWAAGAGSARAVEPSSASPEDLALADDDPERDDSLTLLFLCCHPSLTTASQIALTLRAMGGLTTAQIARAFLVPEATMAQRISRAKQTIRSAGAHFTLPPAAEHPARLGAVLQVLYLIFNEGYTASAGATLQRADLTGEAIRLARDLRTLLPSDGEVAGLLALMLLTDARRAARVDAAGNLVPLADQDRARWDRAAIDEGVALLEDTLPVAPVGPYQLQAAIAAIHDEAPTAEATDWRQIVALYELLAAIAPNPMVTLNQAVAIAMVDGPAAGLRHLAILDADERLAGHHRVDAVRAHLLELAGALPAARAAYELAARRTSSFPEQRYLQARAKRLADAP